MPRQISTTSPRIMINVSIEEKCALVEEANRRGYQSISEYFQAIARKKLVYINDDANRLLEYIRANANS